MGDMPPPSPPSLQSPELPCPLLHVDPAFPCTLHPQEAGDVMDTPTTRSEPLPPHTRRVWLNEARRRCRCIFPLPSRHWSSSGAYSPSPRAIGCGLGLVLVVLGGASHA
eukprot:1085338-Pyramimonas_sp.AAC.2